MLVQGEPVRPQPTLLSLRGGGDGCSLAWLDVGGAPVITAGVPATMVIETRDPAGKRIPNVRPPSPALHPQPCTLRPQP